MNKPSLLQERIVYKPFEYPEASDYWLKQQQAHWLHTCLLYTSPSPRDRQKSRMPSSA